MTDDDREKLRQECHADLDVLRRDPAVLERVFRLLERLVVRLDRLETGSFPAEETPTEPDRTRTKKSSGAMPAFRAKTVIDELEKGKKDGE